MAPASDTMCIDIDECKERPYVCSQLCENRAGSYSCKCAQGYQKSQADDDDGYYCKVAGVKVEAKLFFTSNYYLRSVSLQASTYELLREGFGAARGLAYDYNASCVFVLDGARRQLLKVYLNSSTTTSNQNRTTLTRAA